MPTLITDIQKKISLQSSIEIFPCDISILKEEISTHLNLFAIFDITDSINDHYIISKICEENFHLLFLFSDDLPYKNKNIFSLSSSKENLNKAIISTLNYLNWTAGLAVSNVEKYSNAQIMLSNYSQKIELFSISSETLIQEYVQKEFMKLGSSLFYLWTDKKISIEIQQALLSSKMITNGTGILLIGESSYDSTIEGALAIVEKDKETISSNHEYLSFAISQIVSLLNNATSIDDSLILLSKYCPNNYCANKFSLLNIHKSQRKVVGSIDDGILVLNSSIVFPGNSTDIPASQKKIIFFSANDGAFNPGSVAPMQSAIIYSRGYTLALKDMNNGIDILQNFQLKLNHFDCGQSAYNATFCYNCFNKDKDKLGLAHLVGSTSAVAYGQIATMAKLNITIPLIGSMNLDPGLSNSTKYPFYTRVSLPNDILYTQIPLLLKVLGWTNIAIVYQNESSSILTNSLISQACSKQNINIVNKKKAVPALLTREQLRNYTDVFQEIVDTNVRLVIIVMAVALSDYSAELFYDLGMRKGDLVLLTVNPAWLSTIGNKDDYTYKRLEAANTLISVFQSLFIGEKGEKVHDDLYRTYGNTEPASWACLYYDAAYLIGAALDWSIKQGRDFMNPYVLQSAIRNIKFVGCSGNIYIQKNKNDPILTSYSIQSVHYNETTGASKIYDVGYFKPTSSQIFTIKIPLVYADGTTNKPTDFRITRTTCPFDDILKRTFAKGRDLVFGICFFVASITIIITFFIWRKWWNIEVMMLMKKEEISASDMIAGATIVIEIFQLISMGPDIQHLSSFIAAIGDGVSLDLSNFLKLENGTFWLIAAIVITLCFLWTVFCIEILFHLDEKFNNVWCCRALGTLADYSMPILGNLCFIPFISTLLEIFVCDHSIGNNFTDSYLSIDCYQFCWQGDHITYAVLATFSLICYEPFAVFCRPLWQEFQQDLHVKSFPLYLMVKTVIQVILIVLNKTLKRSSSAAHGFVFTFLILIYVAFFLKYKAYNYERFNWWHTLSLIGVAWVSSLCTINLLIKGSSIPWISLILGGWSVIIVVGFIVQKKKYPSLLYRREKDTSTLFRFAFTFGKISKAHHSKIEPQKLDLFK